MRAPALVLALATLLALGTAGAQDWFGVRSGYPLGVTIHYGLGNALAAGTDLRISGRVTGSASGVRFGVGIDALTGVWSEGPMRAYVGGGPSLDFGRNLADLGLHGLAGGEFRFSQLGLPPLSVFLEASLGASLSLSGGSARIPTFGAALGFNWYF
jgi:hypothetical protein